MVIISFDRDAKTTTTLKHNQQSTKVLYQRHFICLLNYFLWLMQALADGYAATKALCVYIHLKVTRRRR